VVRLRKLLKPRNLLIALVLAIVTLGLLARVVDA